MTCEQFVNICKKYNIDINDNIYQQFVKFYEYLIEENSKYNLTTIVQEDDVFYKHFLDSIIPVSLIPDNSKIIDIGCGAGFPSVPLKIINSSYNFTLIDSVSKKVNFVNNLVKNQLKLNNIAALHTRIEDIAHNSQYREQYDICVSRAVANLPSLLEYAIPFLKIGGKFIVYKGSNAANELIEAANAIHKLNCVLIDSINIHIDEKDAERTILVFEKTAKTPNIYPRMQNKVRKNPL